ncbi:hypothetical protein ACH40F_52465 [Streptomyces sp. NPDC020794]|uniref:hypothetical protein n=1 Tax=unclassified Streptomyces TaxID=2593676 RepID=UPI0036EAFBCE
MKNQEIFDQLRGMDEVLAICICGSQRMQTADSMSDTDAWVFVDNSVALSEAYCTDIYLPGGIAHEILSEGRDHTDVEWVVFNVLTADGILNLKFLTVSILSDFCTAIPSLDNGYMEDLENYWTMAVVWQKDDVIGRHKKFLQDYAIRRVGEDLTHRIVSRYASTYWRSVFQGFLRNEDHAWRFLVGELVKDLCDIAHLKEGRLPVPRKWAFSRAVMESLPVGDHLVAALEQARTAEAGDGERVLGVYLLLEQAENDLLDVDYLHREFWWRSVFFERINNLPDVPLQLRLLADRAPRPQRLSKTTVQTANEILINATK